MSMKDIKNNKENPNMQTESKSIGTHSSNTQNNLNNEELNELKRQKKLIVKYLTEIQENQKTRAQEHKAMTSKLKETAEVFRSSGIQAHNDFVDIAQEMLRKVRASHEHYQKRQKQLFIGIGAMLLVFMLFALIMTIGSDFMSFLHIDTLQNVIASKIKASEGFMTYCLWLALYIRYRAIYWLV